MYSLLIDTHDKDVLLVLYKNGKVLDKICKESNLRHSEITMPSLVEIMDRNDIQIGNIDEIITVVGPGSFTGVRIGVVIAKTIAYLLKKPIKCITSIDLLYYSNNLKAGCYRVNENKGFFVSVYNNFSLKCESINYYSKDDYIKTYGDTEVFFDVNLDLEKIYLYASKLANTNPHLVNPIYVKQIEALK